MSLGLICLHDWVLGRKFGLDSVVSLGETDRAEGIMSKADSCMTDESVPQWMKTLGDDKLPIF